MLGKKVMEVLCFTLKKVGLPPYSSTYQTFTLLIYSSFTYQPPHLNRVLYHFRLYIHLYTSMVHPTPQSSLHKSIQMEKLSSPSSSDPNEFEFGCTRPTSPTCDPKRAVSPADEFFHNGRLLPHSFPVQARISARRASSSSSRDSLSLVSSRSSSTSSSSSTPSCGSARTSSSDAADRKAFQRKIQAQERLSNQGSNYKQKGSYGITFQKWQLFINVRAAPVLDPSGSRRRRRARSCGEFGWKLSPNKMMIKESDEERRGFCERVLRSFVKNCKACHAMEEGATVEDDHHLDSFVDLK